MKTDKKAAHAAVTIQTADISAFMQSVQNYVNGVQGAFKAFSVVVQHETKELSDAAAKFQAACKPVEP